MNTRHWVILQIALLALLIFSACSGAATTRREPDRALAASRAQLVSFQATVTPTKAPTGTPTAAASATITATTTVTATTVPTDTLVTTTVEAEDFVYGPGDFDLLDPLAGLAELDVYTATLDLYFEGIVESEPVTATATIVMVATQDPPARQVTIQGWKGATEFVPVWMAEVDGVRYERRGEGPCTVQNIRIGQSLADLFEPALALDGVSGAEEAGSESINGVTSDRYAFDQRALGEDEVTEVSGEMWVAAADGYILQYQLTREGDQDFFGEGIQGTETIAYTVNVPEAATEIIIPEDCPSGAVQAPLLPDAEKVERGVGILSFESATPFVDAAAFYLDELVKQGWTLQGRPAVREAAAHLSFRQDDRVLLVFILPREGGGVLVTITQETVKE